MIDTDVENIGPEVKDADEFHVNSDMDTADQLNETFNSEENTEKMNQILNQGSRTITRPIKPRESISPNVPLNTTRTMVRERQKTMVVESQLVTDIRKLLTDFKVQEVPEMSNFDRRLISIVQKYENDMNSRLFEAASKTKTSRDAVLYETCAQDLRKMMKLIISDVNPNGNGSNVSGKPCNGMCDGARKLRLDLDSAAAELDKLHQEYSKLYESFGKSRNLLHLQKKEYITLENVLHEDRTKYKKLLEKFIRLREDATRKLEQASEDVVACEARHDEDTKGLRLKVKKFELELKAVRQELELKTKEAIDLRDMLNTLVTDLGETSDVESER